MSSLFIQKNPILSLFNVLAFNVRKFHSRQFSKQRIVFFFFWKMEDPCQNQTHHLNGCDNIKKKLNEAFHRMHHHNHHYRHSRRASWHETVWILPGFWKIEKYLLLGGGRAVTDALEIIRQETFDKRGEYLGFYSPGAVYYRDSECYVMPGGIC